MLYASIDKDIRGFLQPAAAAAGWTLWRDLVLVPFPGGVKLSGGALVVLVAYLVTSPSPAA
jgi:hypothetical protein